MNPKFKKIIIIAIVVVVVGFAALFAYFGLSSVTNVTITDFKIVDENNNIMKDQYVYIGENQNNDFKINVKIEADGQSGGYYFYSTNEDVANVVERNNSYYVEYYNSGKATIVAQSSAISSLRDSIDVTVYENYAIDFNFEDSTSSDGKTINVFADGNVHSYKFDIQGYSDEFEQNSRFFKVVETSNDALFETANINSNENTLELSAKVALDNKIVQTSNEYIVIQSYIRDSSGTLVVKDNYIIKVNVVFNEIVDMQLVVSDNYAFTGDTNYVFSMLSDEKTALSTLNTENEKLIRKVFLSRNINTIYFKIRIVFANGYVEYVTNRSIITTPLGGVVDSVYDDSENAMAEAEEFVGVFTLKSFGSESFTLSATATYSYINSSDSESSVVSGSTVSISQTFIFIVISDNSGNFGNLGSMDLKVTELYSNNNGVYEYAYFDSRFKRVDYVTNLEGEIIGFTNSTAGYSYISRDSDTQGEHIDGIISYYQKVDPVAVVVE